MYQIRVCGKAGGHLEIEEKDLGIKGKNSSVRMSRKIQLQCRGSHSEQNNDVQLFVHVSLFKARNMAITKEERNRAAMIMYKNYICQYKALLLQCDRNFDILINVRLYQEIVLPYFQIKHGQFTVIAL